MKKTIFLFSLCLLLLLTGCSDNRYSSVEEVILSQGIQIEQILYKKDIQNSIIVVYENTNGGVDTGIIYNVDNKYEWIFGGGTSFPSNENDVAWNWVYINTKEEEKQYQFYIGALKEKPLTSLHIKSLETSEYIDTYADIVKLNNGTILWFALQDKYSNVQPGFILNGFDKDGKNILYYEAEQSIR